MNRRFLLVTILAITIYQSLLISCDRRPFPTYSTIGKFQLSLRDNKVEEVEDYINNYKDICMFEFKNFDGSSINAVSSAVISGNVELLKSVLKNKAAIDYQNKPGDFTALSLATELQRLSMMKLLIDHSASISITDYRGNNVLHGISLFFRNIDALNLMQGSLYQIINSQNNANMTPLFTAILEDQEAVPPKIRNPEFVKWLLDHGAQVNGIIGANKEFDVIVPLLQRKDNEYLKMIFSYAVKPLPNTIHNNMNYLHLAIWYQNWEMVPVFVPLVDDINHQDAEGRTALHIAGYFNDVQTIQFLLDNGANKSLRDQEGRTAYDIYVETYADKNPEMLALLK